MTKFGQFYFKMYICTPKKASGMKKSILSALIIALAWGCTDTLQAQNTDRAAMEHELAITAYNYAVGCAERQKFEEALEGLGHIPAGQLNAQQQAWADSLRMQCEAMVGHPMAAYEVELTQSEQLALDDQSDAFLRAIRQYESGFYAQAAELFTEVIEMGVGPREQVCIEALFWRGQCQYQLEDWEQCCKDLIAFNDAKTDKTDATCDALAYYTMGYARMQQKKWHHARLNFERYTKREKNHQLATWSEGESRLKECRQLESKGGNAPYDKNLSPIKPDTHCGETLAILNTQSKVDQQQVVEHQANVEAANHWRGWKAPYIEE